MRSSEAGLPPRGSQSILEREVVLFQIKARFTCNPEHGQGVKLL